VNAQFKTASSTPKGDRPSRVRSKFEAQNFGRRLGISEDGLGTSKTLYNRDPHSPTHWEPSGPVPGPYFLDHQERQYGEGCFPGVRAADFGTASPCGGRLYGRPAILSVAGRFPVWADAFGSLDGQSVCRGNARRRPHRVRAAAVARGRCPRLRAFAAGGLPGDCAGRVAGSAALPSAPHPSGRAGALDRRRDAWSKFAISAISVSSESRARWSACSAR
jgi:hypothetical protein